MLGAASQLSLELQLLQLGQNLHRLNGMVNDQQWVVLLGDLSATEFIKEGRAGLLITRMIVFVCVRSNASRLLRLVALGT